MTAFKYLIHFKKLLTEHLLVNGILVTGEAVSVGADCAAEGAGHLIVVVRRVDAQLFGKTA